MFDNPRFSLAWGYPFINSPVGPPFIFVNPKNSLVGFEKIIVSEVSGVNFS